MIRTSEVPGSEPLASGLSFQLLDAPTSVVSGSLVPVTFQLRNDSFDRLVPIRSAHVDVVLVDAGGIAVTDAGCSTPLQSSMSSVPVTSWSSAKNSRFEGLEGGRCRYPWLLAATAYAAGSRLP